MSRPAPDLSLLHISIFSGRPLPHMSTFSHIEGQVSLLGTHRGQGRLIALLRPLWMPNFLQNLGALALPPEPAVFSELPPHAPDLPLQS